MQKQHILMQNNLKLLLVLLLIQINVASIIPTQQSHNDDENTHTNAMSYPKQNRHKSYDTNDDVVHGNDEQQQQSQVATLNGNNSRHKRELSDWLIAPGTRWCGRGNTANGTYNHLGGASNADKCCRRHDHCALYIPAMNKRYELFNYRPYTLSHCNCDSRFRTCLKMANDEDADTIGKLFFNMMQTHCFRLRKEKICIKRSEDGSCEKEQIKQKAHLMKNKKF